MLNLAIKYDNIYLFKTLSKYEYIIESDVILSYPSKIFNHHFIDKQSSVIRTLRDVLQEYFRIYSGEDVIIAAYNNNSKVIDAIFELFPLKTINCIENPNFDPYYGNFYRYVKTHDNPEGIVQRLFSKNRGVLLTEKHIE